MSAVVLATGGYDQSIRFWEAPSGNCYRTIPFPESQVNRLQITPNRKYIAAAGKTYVRMFEIRTSNPNPVSTFEGHTANVTDIGFQKDGKWMFSSSEDKSIKLWDVSKTDLVAGDYDGNVLVWNLSTNMCSGHLQYNVNKKEQNGESGNVIIASNNRGHAMIWQPDSDKSSGVHSCKLKADIKCHDTYILHSAISPSEQYLATASADSTVCVWNIANIIKKKEENPAPSQVLSGHTRWVWDCVFSDDSAYLLSCSSDSTARLWGLSNGRLIREYLGHHKSVTSVALHDISSPEE